MADLEKLEDEERAISRRRGELLAEIDRLHPDALSDSQSARLEVIREEERSLSARRRTLQHQIDGLRLRLRLPQGPRPESRNGWSLRGQERVRPHPCGGPH